MSSEQIKPGYKRTEVGVIPIEWTPRRVYQFGTVVTGGTPATSIRKYWHGDHPWVTPTDISGRRDISESQRTLTDDGLRAIRSLPANSVLITCIASIGKNAILRKSGGCNQQINAVIPNDEHYPDFLYYMFEAGKGYLLANSGTTATSIVSKATFEQLEFPVPTLTEQRAIAIVLSDVDTLLDKIDQLIAKKRDLKQAAMQRLLTGQTRLPGFSGEWEVKRLEEISICNWGNTSITKSAYRESGTQAYSASGPDGFVDWCEQEGIGVVISAIGAQCGKTWLTMEKWTPIKNTIWFRGIAGKADTRFLYWATNDPAFWPSRGQAQPFIALEDVRSALVSSPPLAEQTAIATILSDMDAELAALESRRDKTRALKQGMMQELLTGQIRLI